MVPVHTEQYTSLWKGTNQFLRWLATWPDHGGNIKQEDTIAMFARYYCKRRLESLMQNYRALMVRIQWQYIDRYAHAANPSPHKL